VHYGRKGGYLFGDGASAEPQFLMDEDVILVTINYRLGALGKRWTVNLDYPDLNSILNVSLIIC